MIFCYRDTYLSFPIYLSMIRYLLSLEDITNAAQELFNLIIVLRVRRIGDKLLIDRPKES